MPEALKTILLIGPLPPPMGGNTRHFVTLIEDLRKRADFRVKVINTSRGQKFSRPGHNFFVGLKTLVAVAANLWRVDIVSYHASDRGMFTFGPLIVALAKLSRTPTVLRVFGGSFGDFYRRQNELKRAIIRKLILSSDVVLVQTRRIIAQLEGQASGALVWFSTYVKSATPASPLDAARAHAGLCSRFVFLGHLWRTKGIETLLEAAPHLPPGCNIDIYGPPDEYTAEQIDQRGMGRVSYGGFLTHAEVDVRLWDYDCLVLPTYHPGEGYPGVIAEAFAHGLPVIATRWLAIPEIVDEQCGILIEPRDTQALVSAIEALYRDRARWLKLKQEAANRAARFDHAVWSRKFEEICEALVR